MGSLVQGPFSSNYICRRTPEECTSEQTDVERQLSSSIVRGSVFYNDVAGNDTREEVQQRINGVAKMSACHNEIPERESSHTRSRSGRIVWHDTQSRFHRSPKNVNVRSSAKCGGSRAPLSNKNLAARAGSMKSREMSSPSCGRRLICSSP